MHGERAIYQQSRERSPTFSRAMQHTKPFTTTRCFSINLSGTPVEIEAQIGHCAYIIMRATDTAGRPFDVSLDDLEVFETTVERMIERTETRAVDMETGRTEPFTVASMGADILAIQNVGGYVLPRCSPTGSERAESWRHSLAWSAFFV